MHPPVSELAVDGVSVTVACRLLTLARQPYYRWCEEPVNEADLAAAHRENALVDAHRESTTARTPSSATGSWARRPARPGSRWPNARLEDLLGDGLVVYVREGARSQRRGTRPAPVHDDVVKRDFTADPPNQM